MRDPNAAEGARRLSPRRRIATSHPKYSPTAPNAKSPAETGAAHRERVSRARALLAPAVPFRGRTPY
jgi:hypothetical protein